MQEQIKNIVESPVYRMIYFAVILILIIMIAWYHMKKSENLIGTGVATGGGYYGATAGATMRRLSTGFSQPGQGNYSETHIPEIKEVFPTLLKKKGEHLVGTRQEPNFMEIGNELEAYQYAESGAMKQDVAGGDTGSEYLAAGSPIQKLEESRLYDIAHA